MKLFKIQDRLLIKIQGSSRGSISMKFDWDLQELMKLEQGSTFR
jgi:hypothetical protein